MNSEQVLWIVGPYSQQLLSIFLLCICIRWHSLGIHQLISGINQSINVISPSCSGEIIFVDIPFLAGGVPLLPLARSGSFMYRDSLCDCLRPRRCGVSHRQVCQVFTPLMSVDNDSQAVSDVFIATGGFQSSDPDVRSWGGLVLPITCFATVATSLRNTFPVRTCSLEQAALVPCFRAAKCMRPGESIELSQSRMEKRTAAMPFVPLVSEPDTFSFHCPHTACQLCFKELCAAEVRPLAG